MPTSAYEKRRGQLLTYFDETAVAAWERLTSDAPVGRVRETVRAGRNRMRDTLLDWLPQDLHGKRVLDAGCGTGALSIEAARRGAHVIAVDLSPTLVQLAQERAPTDLGEGSVEWCSGDMLQMDWGHVDYVVAMDSLIHYQTKDVVDTLAALAERTEQGMLFTFAPRTNLLMLKLGLGRLFPAGNRSPAIVPATEARLRGLLAEHPDMQAWQTARTRLVTGGFYTSQALEVVRG